jgi:putative DNA primase/helicase
MVWDAVVWREDDKRVAFSEARKICREAAALCGDKQRKLAAQLASAKTRAAVISLASDDQALAAGVSQWDVDDNLLGGPSGTVDLRTGELLPPDPDDHISRAAAVAPGGDCPLWRAFLKKVTAGDDELAEYLARVAGYCLTGHTGDHAIFLFWGTGGNGKGTFVNTLLGVVGGGGRDPPPEPQFETRGDRHPTELAMLRGARLVVASETQAGRHWNESRIKALSGGDPISARFMRGDFFTFVPRFKLVILGNHKPALRNVDEAIRRRLHLVPFTVQITPEERDPNLAEKLKAEWPGILAPG